MSHRASQLRATFTICFGAACGSKKFTLCDKIRPRDHYWLVANALIKHVKSIRADTHTYVP
jgi:hypothetical protein